MSKLSKLRNKLIAVLAVLFCALLALSTALFIPKNEKAGAKTISGALNVGNLVKSGTGADIIFDHDNLAKLYNRLTGVTNATFADVEAMVGNGTTLTAQQIRSNAIGGTSVTLTDTAGEFNVNFGDKQWIPTYLSKAGDDVILTLWLAESTQQSVWNEWGANNVSYTYTSNLYSTSKIRSFLVDSLYIPKGSNASSPASSLSATGVQDSTWAKFINNYGDFFVEPKYVKWQEEQTARISLNGHDGNSSFPNGYKTDLPNECFGVPAASPGNSNATQMTWNNSNGVNMAIVYNNGLHGAWSKDKIWLPSLSETGNSNSWYGMWRLSKNQQSNSNVSWLRSGSSSYADKTPSLGTEGVEGAVTFTNNYVVRPAFHLNLTKLEHTLPVPSDITCVYNGAKQYLNTLDSQPDWYEEVSDVYSSNKITVTYPNGTYDMMDVNEDGYKVTVTIKETERENYQWADSDDPTSDCDREFYVKITPKKIALSTLSVTDGVVSGGTILGGQIFGSDTGERSPDVRLVYSGISPTKYPADGSADDAKYVAPTRPGNYSVKAEIINSDTCTNYVLDKEYSISQYTIDKIKVNVPTPDAKTTTYTGKEISFVFNYYDKENVKLTSDGGMAYEENEEDKTITFKATDVVKCTVKFALNDPYSEKVWNDGDRSVLEKTVDLEIKPAELRLNFENSSINGGWSFGLGSNIDISVSGIGIMSDSEGVEDNVEFYIVYSSTLNPTQLPVPGNPFNISDTNKWQIDTYTLNVSLAAESSSNKNKNYKIIESTQKQFIIISPEATFSGVTWRYTNPNIDDGIYQQVPSGTPSLEVTYNKGLYEFSIDESLLYDAGVQLDKSKGGGTGYEGTSSGKDAFSDYVQLTVYLVAREGYQELAQNLQSFTLTWRINKANFNLDEIEPYWVYTITRAGGITTVPAPYPSEGVQYEGGDLITVELKGLPDGLEVDIYEGIASSRQVSDVPYQTWIKSFKISDTNYNVPEIPSDKNWVRLEWQIIKRELPTGSDYWTPAKFSGGVVSDPPTLITAPYNAGITYKYYKDNNGVLGEEIDKSELKYTEGEETYFFVEAILDAPSAVNFYLGTAGNPYRFKVGQYLTPVEITIAFDSNEDFLYNGEEKEAFLSNIKGSGVTADSFVIVYYQIAEDGTETVCGTPVNVGKYKVVVTLNSEFGSTHMITNDNYLEFEILPRVLEAPTYTGTLTYNGKEQDIAKLVGLPDGWEKYINISIIRTGGNSPEGSTIRNTGTYTATFTIKDGVNGDDLINVEWNSATNKTGTKTVSVTMEQLVLHAKSWEADGYYTVIVFEEADGEKFVTYTVKNSDGEIVDENAFYASPDDEYTIEVSVATEHGENVRIEYADGVSSSYKFSGKDDGNGGSGGSGSGGDNNDLADKKQAAKDALQKDADKKNAEIEASDMTDEEKAKAKAEVEAELQRGFDNIDKAASESEINSAYTESKTIIEEVKIIRKSSSSFPWWIIAVVAGALAVAVIVIVVLKKRKATAEGDDYYGDDYDYDDGDDEYDYDEEEIIDDYDE